MLRTLFDMFSGTRTRADDEEDAREVEEARESRRALGIASSDDSLSDEGRNSKSYSGGGTDDESSSEASTTTTTTTTTETDSESGSDLRAPLTRYEARWRASAYLDSVPSRLYKQECGQMARCAALFERHLSPLTPHYLLDPATVNTLPRQLHCYDIYIELAQRGQPVQGLQDTFLVPRALHYIYSYLVDRALRRRDESEAVRRRRHLWLKQKRRRMHFCRQHPLEPGFDARRCPVEWVLYTRQSGQFVQFVQRVMDNNLVIDYNMQPHCVAQEQLSYHLVNLLCAPIDPRVPRLHELVGVERVEKRAVERDEYLDWITVPLFFLDIWNARAQTDRAHAL